MKTFKSFKNNSNGEIMIESTIVMFVVTIVLLFLIALGFLIYQQTMLYSVAAETATAISRDYKFINDSNRTLEDSTVIPESSLEKVNKYRLSFKLLSSKNKKTRQDKANAYIKDRVALTSLSSENDTLKVEKVETYPDAIGRFHVYVEISMDSTLPFDKIFEYVGTFDEDPTKIYASASAECLDITAYAGQVKFFNYATDKINNSAVGGIANSFIDAYEDVKDIVTKLFGKDD